MCYEMLLGFLGYPLVIKHNVLRQFPNMQITWLLNILFIHCRSLITKWHARNTSLDHVWVGWHSLDRFGHNSSSALNESLTHHSSHQNGPSKISSTPAVLPSQHDGIHTHIIYIYIVIYVYIYVHQKKEFTASLVGLHLSISFLVRVLIRWI